VGGEGRVEANFYKLFVGMEVIFENQESIGSFIAMLVS
jgi:hypothetical protein